MDSAALFGSLCRDEDDMHNYFKKVLEIDPDARETDVVLRARLTMVWEVCKTRAAVETKEAAERADAQLPPQLTLSDFETARAAYEATMGTRSRTICVPSSPCLSGRRLKPSGSLRR